MRVINIIGIFGSEVWTFYLTSEHSVNADTVGPAIILHIPVI